MYKTQKGCLPSLVTSIGGLFFVGSLTYIVILDIIVATEFRSTIFYEELSRRLFSALVITLIFLLLIIPLTLMIAGMFPALRVTKEGLKYRFLGFWGGLIHWKEIEEIIDIKWPHNYKAIVISRKGLFLFNGLWSHVFYGLLFVGQLVPIILISPSVNAHEELQKEIYKNMEPKKPLSDGINLNLNK